MITPGLVGSLTKIPAPPISDGIMTKMKLNIFNMTAIDINIP